MKRTSIQLADGRELIYFDERDDAVRDEIDRRDLPPQPTAGELRYDPLVDEWVAIAAHRQTRTFLPATSDCPLCPSTVDRSTEIPAFDYDRLWWERSLRSVANFTREDAREFLALAARHGVHATTHTYPLTRADEALRDLKAGRFDGAAVLVNDLS